MGLTTCSDPGFAVLQPSFKLGEQEKDNSFILFGESFVQTALVKTAMTRPWLFSALFMLCCCSVCWAAFPSLRVPRAFLVKAPNTVD